MRAGYGWQRVTRGDVLMDGEMMVKMFRDGVKELVSTERDGP